MNTALLLPCPSSVRSPEEIASVEVDLYNPGANVWPPRFPATAIGAVVRPAASLYAIVNAACARCAAVSPAWIDPVTCPGGKPTTEVPVQTPRSPFTVVGPVLVTAVPARTPKLAAAPRFINT